VPRKDTVKATKNPAKRATKKSAKAVTRKPARRAPAEAKRPRARAEAAPAGADIRSVSFVSLGCPKNLVDSEKMLGTLAADGIVPVSDEGSSNFGGADAVVVNTCGFLEASKEESLSVIREALAAKDRGEVKRVVVAGCLVQRHRAKMLEWAPGIDAMIGVFDRDKVTEAVRGAAPTRLSIAEASDQPRYWIAGNALQAAKERGISTVGLTVNGKDGKGLGYFEDDSARLRLTPRHYAYLRISEGCNQRCTFCTIPSIRGKMRSKPLDRIAEECRELIQDGAFEINLIGQDTTSFGDDLGTGLRAGLAAGPAGAALKKVPDFEAYGGLPALLATLDRVVRETAGSKDAAWLRLMYAYPSNFSDPIIDAFAHFANHGALCKYLDMPLQHASDAVLKGMRRNVTRAQQARVIDRLRERIPGMAVRTTFIVGFPGETEDDHKQLLEFVGEMKFEMLGVFEYSQEEGTVAGTMEQDPKLAVSAEVKARRKEEVMLLQQKIAFERAEGLAKRFDERRPLETGERLDVLIDAPMRSQGRATSGVGAGGRLYQGRTGFQAPMIDSVTFVQSREELAKGEVVRCVIVGSEGYDLIARPVADLERRVGLPMLKASGPAKKK
jgi:ribosomal protein S12 methylthiotransferase